MLDKTVLNVLKKNRWEALAVLVSLFLIAVLVWEVAKIKSVESDIDAVKKQISKLEKAISRQNTLYKEKAALKRRLSSLMAKLNSFQSDALAFAFLQGKLAEISKGCGADLKSVRITGTRKAKDEVYITNLYVYVRGTPTQVLRFLEEFESLSKDLGCVINRVTISELSYRKGGEYTYSMTLNMRVGIIWKKEGKVG